MSASIRKLTTSTKSAAVTAPGNPPASAELAIMAGLAEKYSPLEKLAIKRASRTVDWLRNKFPVMRVEQIDLARHWVKFLPDEETLRQQYEQFSNAIHTPATNNEIRLIVAALVDGIGHASATASAGWIATLIFQIEHADDDEITDWAPSGLSLPILYATNRRLIARCRYCPSIAEYLEEAKAVRIEFVRAANATDRLLTLLWSAEDLVDLVDHPVDVEDDDNPLPF